MFSRLPVHRYPPCLVLALASLQGITKVFFYITVSTPITLKREHSERLRMMHEVQCMKFSAVVSLLSLSTPGAAVFHFNSPFVLRLFVLSLTAV